MAKIIKMTGSPKSAGFSIKAVFLSKLAPFGYSQSKITKKNNKGLKIYGKGLAITKVENKLDFYKEAYSVNLKYIGL